MSELAAGLALRCPHRSVSPGTCSTNVAVLQSTGSQKNLRTLSNSTVGWLATGRSVRRRR